MQQTPPHRYFHPWRRVWAVGLAVLAAACQRPVPAPEITKPEPPVIERPAEIARLPEPSAPKPPAPALLPESVIAPPDLDNVSPRVAYDTLLSNRPMPAKNGPGWQYRRTRQGKIVGFEFSNHGGNPILPPRRDAARNLFFTRDYQFRFDDRARQDIYLLITDWAPSPDRQFRLSELMNSLVHFFPRVTLPAIRNDGMRNIVTLPTGEEVAFDAVTHEIRSGVLAEEPVDLNPDRFRRKFPGLEYRGKGLIVRSDARGADPRIKTTAVITHGSISPGCASGGCSRCEVPARDLWEPSGSMRFKFATDEAFDSFLRERCGFGIHENSGTSPTAAR